MTRPDFSWPEGSSAAVAFTFDLDAESAILAVDTAYATRPSVMSHQAYGPLAGVPRLLGVLESRRVLATFFIPGFTAERYPEAVAAIVDSGHEVAHHGYLHRPPALLTPEEERYELERGLEALERRGVRPVGYRAPWWDASHRTLDLIAEHGFAYDASLFDGDVPYAVSTPTRTVVEIPQSWALDDWERYAYLPDPPTGLGGIERPSAVADAWWEEIDGCRDAGAVCVPVMHPFLSGRPARARALGTLIDRVLADDTIWVTTMSEIAAHCAALGTPPRTLSLPNVD